MGRSDNPQPAAGLQHPQPQQPPSPLNNTYSAQHHQRMHSPLPLSLPSMTPPARAGSSGSSRPHSRHVSVSRGASQPPTGPTPLAAPSNIALPSPSLQPPLPQPKQLSKRSTSPERPPVSPITPPLAHVKPEATTTAPTTTATATATTTTTTTTTTMTKKTGKQNNRTIIISKPNKNAQPMQSTQAAQVTQITPQQQQASQPLSQQLPPRPALTHNNQLDMATNVIPPPTPLPLDLETNPDVIALQSAIAILQMQRRRAEADIIALQHAKNEALAKPEAFLADLRSGAVKMAGGLLPGEHNAGETIPSYSDSDSSDDDSNNSDNDGDIDMVDSATNGGEGSSQDQAVAAARAEKKKAKTTKNQKPPKPAWASLPGEQSIVRCPPINWAQYAVVGESLDKLHAEQVSRPNGGMPAIFTASAGGIGAAGGGTYEFRGASAVAASGPGEKYLGIAAPYVPGRDVLPNSRRKNPTVASVAGGGAAGGGRKNAKPPGRPPKR